MAAVVRPLLRVWQQRNSHLPKLTWVRSIAGLVGILNLTFIVGLPLYLWRWGAWKLVYGVPPVAVGLLGIPILTSVLSAILLILMIVVWQKNYWSWQGRLHYTLVTVAAIAFIFLLAYWNLLGWQF